MFVVVLQFAFDVRKALVGEVCCVYWYLVLAFPERRPSH